MSKCNQNCGQGRECDCHDEDTPHLEMLGLAGIVVVLALLCALAIVAGGVVVYELVGGV